MLREEIARLKADYETLLGKPRDAAADAAAMMLLMGRIITLMEALRKDATPPPSDLR